MKLSIVFLLLASMSANAALTSISHISLPENNMENAEVFLSSGRVYEIDATNIELLKKLELAKKTRAQVELNLEAGPINPEVLERVTDIKIMKAFASQAMTTNEEVTPMTNYTPSNVDSVQSATRMFNHLNPKTKRWSQCFNRAHIWAKQLYNDFRVNSQKILIYYTKRYREDVDKKWWFHIAPVVSVNGESYVLDREFTTKPHLASDWENIFTAKMRSKRVAPTNYRCKQIKNISEYYNSSNQAYEFCNIQYTSMYYWEPNDMEALEEKGIQKTHWVDWELKSAAKEAFRSWQDVYDRYKY